MNAEFQRIARRNKKAFLSDQCNETGNNRMGKTSDLFKKIRDTKGIFHANMGTIKNRNGIASTWVREESVNLKRGPLQLGKQKWKEKNDRRENGEEIFEVIEVEKISILMTVNYELALAIYLSKD